MRIGQGWDVHRLEKGQTLIIGGVKIDTKFGTLAHSDGDVLVHAIIDALLGALALGDIGCHFPDSDPGYKNASSLFLLTQTIQMVANEGYEIGNIDSTIILEKPKLKDHILGMRHNIAETLNMPVSKVSVKAKTNEKIGAVGESLSVEAMANVLLTRRKKS